MKNGEKLVSIAFWYSEAKKESNNKTNFIGRETRENRVSV